MVFLMIDLDMCFLNLNHVPCVYRDDQLVVGIMLHVCGRPYSGGVRMVDGQLTQKSGQLVLLGRLATLGKW